MFLFDLMTWLSEMFLALVIITFFGAITFLLIAAVIGAIIDIGTVNKKNDNDW